LFIYTEKAEREGGGKVDWTLDDIKVVSQKIVDRVRGLNLRSVPSLVKRVRALKFNTNVHYVTC
jgi:hypothetical protein